MPMAISATTPPITVLIDEFGDVAFPLFTNALNKGGGANARFILAQQSLADAEAAMGPAQARRVLDNLNTKIWCRLADDRTAAEATEGLGLCTVRLPDDGVGLSYGGVGGLSGLRSGDWRRAKCPAGAPSLAHGAAAWRSLRADERRSVEAAGAAAHAGARPHTRGPGPHGALAGPRSGATHGWARAMPRMTSSSSPTMRASWRVPGRAHASASSAAPAAGVRTVADAPSSGYSSGPAVSVSPIGGGEHVAQCQCQGPRSRRPALSQRARPPQYWQAGTSRRSSMGIDEDGGICALLQWCVMCGCDGPSVYTRRWERSSVRPCVLGVRVRGPQDHDHPTLTTQGWKCCQT